jgi:Domain of Unknown Function with PDB structure (DUF3857)
MLPSRNYNPAVLWLYRFAAVCLILICLNHISISAQQGQSVRREAIPEWVDMIPIPAARPARLRAVEDGIYNLVIDDQIRMAPGGAAHKFRRHVRKVTDRTGLEDAAQLEVDFDPAVEQFILHKAIVWRDGKAIDVSATAATEVMRREDSLDDGILTNEQTVLVRLNDVRVGDITDFSWSWAETKSYWPSHLFGDYSLGWSVPVEKTRVRVLTQEPARLVSRVDGGAIKPVETRDGATSIFDWAVTDPEPLPSEDDTPSGFERWPELHLSTMKTWSEVVAWERPHYAVDQTLPPDLAAKVDAIAARTQDKSARVTAALRLVQDNVRYTSLSIGSGGYVPRPPRKSWSEGFGDCKDKAVLLVAILNRLGIAAVPALTDIDEGNALSKLPPSLTAFDHVIVRVGGFAKPLWLDPTASHQGGTAPLFADLTYGFALPVRENQTALEAIPAPPPEKATIEVLETHSRTDAGILLDVQTVYHSDEADSIRASLAKTSLSGYEANDLEYYAKLYPGIEQRGTMVVADNRDTNIVRITQHFHLPKTAPDYAETIESYSLNVWTADDIYKIPGKGKRYTAYSLPHQVNRQHSFRLITPGFKPAPPSALDVSGVGFDLQRTSERNDDILTITYRVKGKANMLSPEQVPLYREQAQQLDDEIYTDVNLNSIYDENSISWIFFVLALFVVGGGALLKMQLNFLNSEASIVENNAIYHPVGIIKFIILTTFTIGLYGIYWMWRCWRYYEQTVDSKIMPLGRAIFGVIWFYPLFRAVNIRCEPKISPAIGIFAALVFFAATVISSVGSNIEAPMWQTELYGLAATLATIVLIRMINRLNDPAIVAANSRFNRNHWLALVFSIPFWLFLVTGT